MQDSRKLRGRLQRRSLQVEAERIPEEKTMNRETLPPEQQYFGRRFPDCCCRGSKEERRPEPLGVAGQKKDPDSDLLQRGDFATPDSPVRKGASAG